MKNFIIIRILLLIVFPLVSVATGDTTKTTERQAAEKFQWAISKFTKSEGVFPRSWHQLESFSQTKNDIERIEKDVPSFRDNYRFLRPDDKIKFKYWSDLHNELEIIAMSTTGVKLDAGDDSSRILRVLIVGSQEAVISLVLPTEEIAETVFKRAGKNLADYTGDSRKWAPEISDIIEGTTKNLQNGEITGKTLPKKQFTKSVELPDPHKKTSKERNSNFLLVGITVFFLLALWKIVAKRKKRRDK